MEKPFLLSLFLLLSACSSPRLYIINTFESEWPWETIAIAKNQQGDVRMLQMYRNTSAIESKQMAFQKTERKEERHPLPIVVYTGVEYLSQKSFILRLYTKLNDKRVIISHPIIRNQRCQL